MLETLEDTSNMMKMTQGGKTKFLSKNKKPNKKRIKAYPNNININY